MKRNWSRVRGRADVDHVNLAVAKQILEVAISRGDPLLAGEIEDVIAARSNRLHLRIDPMDAGIRVHMQLGDETASDEAYSHCRDCNSPCVARSS
jgi:hypothetical protein